MKNLFLALFVLSFSVSSFAKTTTLRTLKCTGWATTDNKEVKISGTIKDTKYTDEVGDEYFSTLSITDVENPSKKFFGVLTSTDQSVDIDEQRNYPSGSEDGPVYYDLYKDKKTYQDAGLQKAARTALLVVGSTCLAESGKKCLDPKGSYNLAFMYGGTNVVDEGSKAYLAQMTCTKK